MSIYIKEPEQSAQACIIWLHGLGADASDMASLVEQLPKTQLALRHVFMDAPVRPVTLNNGMSMRAWYDITGLTLNAREDQHGILQSDELIRTVIENQIADGFNYNQIFLAGFSQGGAMALYTALHTEARLAGVISLSSYLPLSSTCKSSLDKTTPFFIAGGDSDPVVLPAWTQFAKNWLQSAGFTNISWHQYPMQHSICLQEVRDISQWLVHRQL